MLVVDETGDVKKGTHTVGVQRQCTGTADRIENSQAAVHLVHAGERGHAAVDRELYVPRSWTCDPDRCRAAGPGEDTVFATKPELAGKVIERFLDARHRSGRVAGDEVSGGNPKLRAAPEERGLGYVLAVACSAEVTARAGTFRADALDAKLPRRAWQKLSAGLGGKDHRYYNGAVIDLGAPAPGHRQLLIRRNHTTGELTYYRWHSTVPVPLRSLVRAAGSRWRVEEAFQAEKGLARLDERPGPPDPVLEPLGHPRHPSLTAIACRIRKLSSRPVARARARTCVSTTAVSPVARTSCSRSRRHVSTG